MSRDLIKTPGKGGSPALAEGIARLRQATGRAERRFILGNCSAKGGGFRIVYERLDPAARFKIAAVEKIDPNAGASGTGPSAPATRMESFNAAEFDHSGFSCPWCGSTAGQVYHDRCGVNYCGRAKSLRADGGEQFSCPTCRETVSLVVADALHGGRGQTTRQDSTGLLGTEKRGLLGRFKG